MKFAFAIFLMISAIFISGLSIVNGHKKEKDKKCKNGGTVQRGVHTKCQCPPGFKGPDCSQQVTPCEGRPCRNNGICREQNETFTCTCTTLYTGLLCEKKVLPCDSGPCKNGGRCTNIDTKCFKCDCATGFKGPHCSKTVKPCEIKPCKNGGTCTDKKDGTFQCSCRNGFAGVFCDRDDALYASEILKGRTKDIQLLERWLKGEYDWRLCYRATDHGWTAAKFHERCDFKRQTITIVRVGKFIFGAYADVPFGGSTGYRASTSAFIFSIQNKDKLPPFKATVYRNSNYALYTKVGYGPTFGGAHDIHIANNANVKKTSYSNFGYTYQTPTGYSYGSTKAKSLLAGSYQFTPNEVEVFYLE